MVRHGGQTRRFAPLSVSSLGIPLAATGLIHPVWATVAITVRITAIFSNSLKAFANTNAQVQRPFRATEASHYETQGSEADANCSNPMACNVGAMAMSKTPFERRCISTAVSRTFFYLVARDNCTSSPNAGAEATQAALRFSSMGYIAVATLIGTGLVNSW